MFFVVFGWFSCRFVMSFDGVGCVFVGNSFDGFNLLDGIVCSVVLVFLMCVIMCLSYWLVLCWNLML